MSGNTNQMSFLEHLEELRWHLIRALIAILVFAIAAFIFREFLFQEIIFAPTRVDFVTFKAFCHLSQFTGTDAFCVEELPLTLQNRTMTGQFTMAITAAAVIGIIISFPYVFWEIWRFVSPGLYDTERKVSKGAVFFVTLLFLLGVCFGYFVVVPISINFLANFTLSPEIDNQFDITSYISTMVMIVLGCGLLFQLPMVVYFLTKAQVITPTFLTRYRRHAIVVILIIAAIVTPPDVFSQILISIPVFLLYEISIYISKVTLRKVLKKEALQESI